MNRFLRSNQMERPLFFMTADGGAGGGTAPPPAPPAAPPVVPPVPPLPPEAQPGYQSLIGRYGGSSDAVATLLYNDNYQLRKDKSELEKQVPKEGMVVLSKEEADALQKFRELGEFDAVKQGLEERDTYKTAAQEATRNEELRKVADALKWDFDVFKDLNGLIGEVSYEMKPVTRGNQSVNVPYVKFKENDADKELTVEDYVSQKKPQYLKALQVDTGPARPGNGAGPNPSGGPNTEAEKEAREKQSRFALRQF
jgi:hypothetical protein